MWAYNGFPSLLFIGMDKTRQLPVCRCGCGFAGAGGAFRADAFAAGLFAAGLAVALLPAPGAAFLAHRCQRKKLK